MREPDSVSRFRNIYDTTRLVTVEWSRDENYTMSHAEAAVVIAQLLHARYRGIQENDKFMTEYKRDVESLTDGLCKQWLAHHDKPKEDEE